MSEFEALTERVDDRRLRVTEYITLHGILGEIMYHPKKPYKPELFGDLRNGHFDNTRRHFTFYVTLLERNFTDLAKFEEVWLTKEPEKCYIDYYDNWMGNLDSWHCGVTFYKKTITNDTFRAVKFGCDYNHYWDEGKSYDFEYLERELKYCIEEIYRCPWIVKDSKEQE